ncbi:MAG TPA: hypothetical protein VK035_07935 [Kiloniellales bacterium]|nr:hypothetical protein [Kiloniellales bacterium]
MAVGDTIFPLGTHSHAALHTQVGDLVLVTYSTGGNLCPAQFVWLNTAPGSVGLSKTFGTCSEGAEVSRDGKFVTVTMQSSNASVGMVAFDYDGERITERMLGLESSDVAKAAAGNPEAWIGESLHEFLRAAENEAQLISALGWDALDELRHSTVVGSERLESDGDWITGSGCRPHMCNTDYGALAIHRQTGSLLAALKSSGEKPRLVGEPLGPLPNAIREVMTRR